WPGTQRPLTSWFTKREGRWQSVVRWEQRGGGGTTTRTGRWPRRSSLQLASAELFGQGDGGAPRAGAVGGLIAGRGVRGSGGGSSGGHGESEPLPGFVGGVSLVAGFGTATSRAADRVMSAHS